MMSCLRKMNLAYLCCPNSVISAVLKKKKLTKSMLVMLANIIFSLVIWKSGNYSPGRYVHPAAAKQSSICLHLVLNYQDSLQT